ncbi:hypothetical protein GTY65_33215 [Streptomyces sp. SID8379]|uniref:DUF5819 family protein n=1 Tax=unclassified Streptomyces TaxID=2593676 RepID=UPI00037C7B42|nr:MULTISPECIES: DUF5819 family protein [unclassified Streptomyces]MYW68901.1 hypothetical protein [Streptomyces sp. SID8379]
MKTEAGAAGEADRPAPGPPAAPPPGWAPPSDPVGKPGAEPSGPAEHSNPYAPPDETANEPAEPALDPAGPTHEPPERRGLAALSPGYQVVAALALAGVVLIACIHILMVFLHVAPANTMTKKHGAVVDEWIYPEFEQNWKLFAPNPLQQNVAVQVRAQVRSSDGERRTTGWYDLSGQDGAAIKGNLFPSHTQQNELRRAWDVFVATHDAQNRPTGLRGTLSEQYLRRILVLRLDRLDVGGKGDVIERVQTRSRATTIAPPKWSDEKVNQKPVYRQVPWWTVTSTDAPLDSGTRVRVQGSAGGAR